MRRSRQPRSRNDAPLLTLSMLTIPSREAYLQRLLRSIAQLPDRQRVEITVVYNASSPEEPLDIERRIRALEPRLPLRVYVNANASTIVGGRAVQLAICRTPLIAFVDDDLTLHGDVVGELMRALSTHPVGVLGLQSFDGDTTHRFKPRDSTPSVTLDDGLRYMPVQGMLVAGYRRLLVDIGGFNPRRHFWGEWTELNLRLWRHGFPTAYLLRDETYLRHWHDAPESPTRNMVGRERHVVWGLMCTALEYDAVAITEATETFWRLAQDRYLAYSFGDTPSPKQLLATVLELMPALAQEFGAIREWSERARTHRFQFKPFEPFTEAQVREVIAHGAAAIEAYRPHAFGATWREVTRLRRWWRRLLGAGA